MPLRILIALLLLASTAVGDWTGLIASELAVATLGDATVTKVARSQCKVCNGTGKIKAGDGRTIVWRECDNCEADAGDEPAAEPEPAEPEPAATGPKRKQKILFFTAKWCMPCQKQKRNVFPAMEAVGWRFGDVDEDLDPPPHVRIVDFDTHPDLVAKYGVGSIPAFVVIDEYDNILGRMSGLSDAHKIRKLWDDAESQPEPSQQEPSRPP